MRDSAAKRPWTHYTFGEMAEHIAERVEPTPEDGEKYVGLEHLDPGSLTVRRWGAEVVLVGTKLRMRKGDILFARRNAYLRRVALAPHDGLFSAHGMVLRARTDVALKEFLPFFMQSDVFLDRAEQISVGSLSPTINWGTLKTQRFALPPIEEQARIASACYAASQLAEATHELRVNVERVRRTLIFSLYRRGTRNEDLRRTPIGYVPNSWDVAPLGERYEVQLGKMMSKKARGGPNHVPYLRNANVQWNRLDLDDVATMSLTERERRKYALRHGDILACEGRHVGKSAIWRDQIPGACFQKALHRLRTLTDQDVPEYMLHCLQYFSWTGRFIAETGETTIPHLPAERLRAMLFPFPPRDQQQEIANSVLACDQAVETLNGRIAATREFLRELQPSIGE